MILEQYQLPCLSISSYLVGDETTGKAVVIDPQRDIGQYLADAEDHNLRIEHVLLTHFHADYVSGHLGLARATGAEIVLGEPASAEFEIRNVADQERIVLGDVVIEAWLTPGHTPESTTYLAFENTDDDVPAALFTGDTLFVNDVGRPDLLGAIGFTAEQLGGMLYDSLARVMTLPDEVVVYPGHGAGSACGKALGSDPHTTIGAQRRDNYALKAMTKEEFIDVVTEGQPAAPAYFLHDAITNRKIHEVFDENQQIPEIPMEDAHRRSAEGEFVIIDTRSPLEFAVGHLIGAVNVPLEGRYAEQAGMVVPADQDVVVVGDDGKHTEAMIRLARIGFDRVVGHVSYYEQSMLTHPGLVAEAPRVLASDIAGMNLDHIQLLDVRNPGETADGTIPGCTVIPLAQLHVRAADEIDASKPAVIYCASGVRSSVAASWLRSNGFSDVSDVIGGYNGWVALTSV
ncbi:MAG: MBL fold metallo-hydrolase [Actinomycetia bacterium]|nr:MBL fold metallo-hydrolase [Actinomycetes bacterium]